MSKPALDYQPVSPTAQPPSLQAVRPVLLNATAIQLLPSYEENP